MSTMSRLTCQLSFRKPQNRNVNYVMTPHTAATAIVISRDIVDITGGLCSEIGTQTTGYLCVKGSCRVRVRIRFSGTS